MREFILNSSLPRPLRPTKRRSLNLATWFFMTAVQLRSSPHQLSSFPARIVTMVPSPTSVKATTLNATGRVLLERQWFGSAEHKMYGLPVRTVKKNWEKKIHSHEKKSQFLKIHWSKNENDDDTCSSKKFSSNIKWNWNQSKRRDCFAWSANQAEEIIVRNLSYSFL